jgi:HD domain
MVQTALGPDLFGLFSGMSLYEQPHALCVCDRVTNAGDSDPDLIAAALLHDVGKRRRDSQFSTLDRVLVVLISRTGLHTRNTRFQYLPRTVRQTLIASELHAEVGADLVRQHGGSARLCWLIAQHQHYDVIADNDLDVLQDADSVC